MKHLLAAAVLALAPMAASAAPIGPFSDLILFGDSLSDTGNAFIATGGTTPDPDIYPSGQFTNGGVWADQFGFLPGLVGGTNFAFGGAKAVTDTDGRPDLAAQIALFRTSLGASALSLGPNPAAAIFIGSNDLEAATSAAEAPGIILSAVNAIATGITTLFDGGQGINDFFVFGLPDLGQFPASAANPGVTPAEATAASIGFNAALNAMFGTLPTGADVTYVDTFAALTPLFANPAAFGITKPDGSCITSEPDPTACTGDLGYLFQDPVHPTVVAHGLIADAFGDAVAPVPLPAGVILILTGLGALGAARHLSRRG
jgi:phospholipase/lecithinase/hemolysin